MPAREMGSSGKPDVFVVCSCGQEFLGEGCWREMWEHAAEQYALDDAAHVAARSGSEMRFLHPKVDDD